MVRVWLCFGVAAMVMTAGGARADDRLLVTQLSKDADWSSGEAWVAVSPRDPQVLTAVWTSFPYTSPGAAVQAPPGPHPVQCGLGYSSDGGRSWTEGTLPFQPVGLPSDPGGCADPTVAVGPDGTFYSLLNGGAIAPGAGTTAAALPSLVSFSASHDDGRTWSAPTKVWSGEDTPLNTVVTRSPDLAFDRPLLVVDPATHALYGSVSDDALVQRVVIASHDHGATWTTPYPLDPDGQSAWSDTISAASGVLAAAYSVDPQSHGYKASASPVVRCDKPCAVFETSTDDGQTWSRHVVPAAQVEGHEQIGGTGVQVAADPSTRGRYAVLLPATATSDEVWVTPDSGTTWSRALTVAGSGGGAATKPWLAFGPTGALGVVWRNLHADDTYEVYAAVSADGGKTFSPKVELTPGAAPPDSSPGAPGDDCACNVTLDRQYLYTSWGDSRNGHRQVWFGRYRLAPAAAASPAGAPGGALPATGEQQGIWLAAVSALLVGFGLAALRRRGELRGRR